MADATRRFFLGSVPALGVAGLLGLPQESATGLLTRPSPTNIDDGFPRQDLSAVEAVVSFSHFHLEKVKELVTPRPALAKASWDWGFGDWESAIGAASHRGQTAIAEFLMEHGARPTIFTFAMLGKVDVLRSMITAQPGIQRTHGPHGFTLMYHAKIGGKQAESVVDWLEEMGDADIGEKDEPIPEDEQRQILGTYVYGKSENEQFEILVERGELRIKRTGRVGRRLARTGVRQFHPTGAPEVRIHFDQSSDPASSLTIEDAALSLVAERT